MILLVLFLLIIPYIYGTVFTKQIKGSRLLAIPCGLTVELLLYAMVSLPTIFLNTKFSFCVYVYVGLNLLILIILGIVWYREEKRVNWREHVYFFIDNLRKNLKKKSILLMLIVVLFQSGRSTFLQYRYGDDRVYTAMINDTVETDTYFAISEEAGNLRDGWEETATKYVLASWYMFEAFLSYISNVKPLMLVYTVLPGYLLLLSYIVWWSLAYYLFKGDSDKASYFVLAMALFNELNAEDISSYILYWPTYGKNITMSIVMPLFILFWIVYNEHKDRLKYVFLMILMAAGCAASTMGLMIMPITLSFLFLIKAIRIRRITFEMIVRYLVLLLPVLIYIFLFIRIS